MPRRRVERDMSYNPERASHKQEHFNLYRMRTDMQETVSSTVLINQQVATDSGYALEELQQAFVAKAAQIKGFRPAATVLYSPSGLPKQVKTPNGTVLKRRIYNGAIVLFQRKKLEFHSPVKPKVISRINGESAFFSSEQYKSVKQAIDNYKLQVVTVTPELLAATEREHADKKRRRSVSQNKVMAAKGASERKASATEYVKAAQVFPQNMRWEWLHLVAHMILGKHSQKEENLVAGSAHANTNMMFAEETLRYLAQMHPEGFTLEIKTKLIKGTQIARKIKYLIRTKTFVLPLVFDAQEAVKPPYIMREYMQHFLEAMVAVGKYKTNEETMPLADLTNQPLLQEMQQHSLFYQKQPHVEQVEEEENDENKMPQPL
jgi:hypothetical protein